jgi:hypothetical protein
MIHVTFDAYPSHTDFPFIQGLAERMKPHADETLSELYRRFQDVSLGDIRASLSDQLFKLSRRVKTQRNELESGFLEGFGERSVLKKLEEKHDSIQALLSLRKAALLNASRIKELVLEQNGWTAYFEFEGYPGADMSMGFAVSEDGSIWVEDESVESLAS